MDNEKLIEDLRGLLKQYGEKIPYGELVGAPWPYSRAGDLVWQDPEPYFIEQAATALSTLQVENARLRAELEYEREYANAYHEECSQWEAENEKLRAEVESLKKEHCAGCSVPVVEAERLRDLNEAPNLRAELEQVKRCIEIVEKQRDAAIEELEKYMVQDVLDGNEPCGICAKASDTPCEYCDPKWRGQKEG